MKKITTFAVVEFEDFPQQGQHAQSRQGYGGQYNEAESGFEQGGYPQGGRGMARGGAPGQRMAPQQFGQEVKV